MHHADVIVIGAGVVGLSVAFELVRAGRDVRVLSADVPGSRQSAGLSRIFRLAHADARLTDAAARSLELWEEWESLAAAPLLDRAGLLLTGEVSDREVHLRAHGGLDHAGGARHPLAVARANWWFEATGAAIRAEETVRFLQEGLALELAEVAAVDGHGVRLAEGARLRAGHVIVCAGADTYRLLGAPEPERVRSVRFSFALREPAAAPVPCWIQRDDALSEPFYSLMDGSDHYSVGLSEAGAARLREAEQIREAHRRVLHIVRRVFPGLVPVAERVIACEFPLNPHGPLTHDGWDLLERDGVTGVTGPSLFKFAPLLGRLVAERVTGGSPVRGGVAGGV